ncbi:MAG: hypothetical protein LBD43_01850 [Holosporales bacterium]|jgi:hypothetical protein|nr:hypothetical protein [Holosporales bacterium]
MNISRSAMYVLCGILLHREMANASDTLAPTAEQKKQECVRSLTTEYGKNGLAYRSSYERTDPEMINMLLRTLMRMLGTPGDVAERLVANHQQERDGTNGATLQDLEDVCTKLVRSILSVPCDEETVRKQYRILQASIIAHGGNIPPLHTQTETAVWMAENGLLAQRDIVLAYTYAAATGQFANSERLFQMIWPNTDIHQYYLEALTWLVAFGEIPQQEEGQG